MANAGGADNAKKIVEVELKMKDAAARGNGRAARS
jgi:hypothetical protein